ncbi:MAG TPA: hypothetical protein VN675_04000 [Burkholderiales bacterium]|nr:hypothetical protein [Burkholderiales bacterium]
MRRVLVLLAAMACVPAATAATRAERCEKYNEELVRIEKAKKKTGSEVRLHKLEAQRQKVLAFKAKHHC